MDNNVFNKELISKIDNFINEKFPFIYDYEFDGIVLLCSGAIRSLIMGVPVKDLDFVLLTQKEGQIKDFVRKFKFKYVINERKNNYEKAYQLHQEQVQLRHHLRKNRHRVHLR